jgi:hypothetical protein
MASSKVRLKTMESLFCPTAFGTINKERKTNSIENLIIILL